MSSLKAMWLNAKPLPIPTNNFPHQIEGMTPSIWYTQYKGKTIIPKTLFKSFLHQGGQDNKRNI